MIWVPLLPRHTKEQTGGKKGQVSVMGGPNSTKKTVTPSRYLFRESPAAGESGEKEVGGGGSGGAEGTKRQESFAEEPGGHCRKVQSNTEGDMKKARGRGRGLRGGIAASAGSVIGVSGAGQAPCKNEFSHP